MPKPVKWGTTTLLGVVLVVQLLNLLWHFSPSRVSPPSCLSPSPPMEVSQPIESPIELSSSPPLLSPPFFLDNETEMVGFLKKNFSQLVQKLKLEQAPFSYSEFWREMQAMVVSRHVLDQPGVRDFYQQRVEKALAEREHILEEYYAHRGQWASLVQQTAQRVKVDNAVVLMAFNWGTAGLFLNWRCSCKRAGIVVNNLLVVSADEKTHALMKKLNMTSLFLPELFGNYQSASVKYFGSSEWSPFGRLKLIVPKLLLEAGIDVFFQDVDVIWLKDPLQYIRSEFPGFDVVIQHVGKQRAMFGPFYGNSGMLFIKGNVNARSCWDRMFFDMDKIVSWTGSQQIILNYHLGLCAAFDPPLGLRVKAIDPFIFVSGWIAQNPQMQKDIKEKQGAYNRMVVYHTNWADNVADKIAQNQKYGFWYLPSTVKDTTDPATIDPHVCV